jgi:ribosomal protein S16
VELLGYYHPRKDPEVLTVDYERVRYWTSKGARLSDTMRSLIVRHPAPPPEEETASPPVVAADTSADETQVTT